MRIVSCSFIVIGVAAMLLLSGCSELTEETGAEQSSSAAPGPPPPPPIAGGPIAGAANEQSSGAAPEAVPTERVKADVGVGSKGRRLENEKLVQMIVQPAVSLFRTRERAVFQIQIPHAMQLYEATHGKKPATNEEFFEQIVKANNLQLPELPAGQRYVYDPKQGQLMVEKPAQ